MTTISPSTHHQRQQKSLPNRWTYVVTGFITLVLGTTTVNALFNVLGTAMSTELGWERSTLSNGLSIQIGLAGVSVIVLGFLTDRWGPKIPASLMASVFGLGIMALGMTQNSEAVFYLICAVIGCASGSANPVVHSGVVSAWFSHKRGIALGILMAGLGSCGVIIPILANALLNAGGWRLVFIIIGLLCVLIPGSIYAFITRMPPAHEAERVNARKEGRTAGESLWTIARKYRQFWLLSLAILLVSSSTFGLMSQVVGMSTDKGIDQAMAVTILSTLSFASIIARLVVGYIMDRMHASIVGTVIFALTGLGVFFMITSSSVSVLLVSAALIGLGLGAEGDIAAYMASRYFPQHSYGRVMGFVYFLYGLGSSVGIFLLGQIHQQFGTYQAALIPFLAMIAISIACLLFMGPYRFTLEYKEVKPLKESFPALQN